ncbi:Scr1 family TA system antitoxin-like transcriptional regulator [Actinoplanes regularis]|uniref:Scr1 family TA system antitoxin-like transcriptional regulator n=1 Tax=Actinoplanes regularis TaxID=52697 RepID=UPI003D7FCA28
MPPDALAPVPDGQPAVATELRVFQPAVAPGLVQTSEYARSCQASRTRWPTPASPIRRSRCPRRSPPGCSATRYSWCPIGSFTS